MQVVISILKLVTIIKIYLLSKFDMQRYLPQILVAFKRFLSHRNTQQISKPYDPTTLQQRQQLQTEFTFKLHNVLTKV